MDKIRTVNPNATIKKIKVELDAEITEKGKVFILLDKTRFKLHRENLLRYMFEDKDQSQ